MDVPCTNVVNLATGVESLYLMDTEIALITASEQAKGNFNYNTYPKPSDVAFTRGKCTIAIGDFCVQLKPCPALSHL